ncbi:hypothetical protein [uncultured Methanobrevibacter sp.]|uniref:hypothetical protein n=1 Tax=uncultured Methanobrevibacter sp. TaxID=253161 RepID=UPI0025DFB9D3|nr:hypothetical protein [uncultured Methanobrevibacter sp.]MEE3491136.1 hypothetical protein [Methanobrevibacter sp.]
MTMFTNGYSTLMMPEGFEPVNVKEQFNELHLVNTKIPMSIKFSTVPTPVGIVDLIEGLEENIKNNDNLNLIFSDFVPVDDDIYYLIESSSSNGENEVKRYEFYREKDNNLYIFEFVFPYADRELDNFYLNIIRSLKISVPKYIVENGEYRLNSE